MASVNRVILVGRLGRDPETRFTQGGTSVSNFSLATDSVYNGNKTTEWHRVTAWKKLSETVAKHLHKGSFIYLEGRIQSRKWENRDGIEQTSFEIVANTITFLDSVSTRRSSENEQTEAATEEDLPESDEVPF